MCHVRHINHSKEYQERIKKTDKKFAGKLDYNGIEFSVNEKDFNNIEVKKKIYALIYLVIKMRWFFQFICQIKYLNGFVAFNW